MKHPSQSVAGVLLAAAFLAVLSAFLIGRAGGTLGVNVRADSGSNARNWKLGEPITHENLTIFPVLSDTADNTDEFITLDEGLRSGKVVVTELSGGDAPVRAPANRQNATQRTMQNNIEQRVVPSRDGAQVNKVSVTNNSGKTLVLIAGEVILGGKQDRIVGHDCIVASTGKPAAVDVFCVEHGRWQESAFGRSRASEGGAAFRASDKGVMAAPKVRANAQAEKSQSAVWSEVADKVSKNNVSTSTGTLNSVYEDKQVMARLDAYERAVKPKFAAPNIIGAVVAVNGRVISADVFASPALFQAYAAKLLKSYALEAVSVEKGTKQEVKASDAEAFLSRSDGAAATADKDGVYRLSEKQSAADASFELEHTTKGSRLIHFNRVSKK